MASFVQRQRARVVRVYREVAEVELENSLPDADSTGRITHQTTFPQESQNLILPLRIAPGDILRISLVFGTDPSDTRWTVGEAQVLFRVDRSPVILGVVVVPQKTADRRSQMLFVISPNLDGKELYEKYGFQSAHAVMFPGNLPYGVFDTIKGGDLVYFKAAAEPGRRFPTVMWAEVLSNGQVDNLEVPGDGSADTIVKFWKTGILFEKRKDEEQAVNNSASQVYFQWNRVDGLPLTARIELPTPNISSVQKFRAGIGDEVFCKPRFGIKFKGFISDIVIAEPSVVTLQFPTETGVELLVHNQPSKNVPYYIQQVCNVEALELQEQLLEEKFSKSLADTLNPRKRTILRLITGLEEDRTVLPEEANERFILTTPNYPAMSSFPQKQATKMILEEKRPVIMIEGPPGAAKSTYITSLVHKLVQLNPEVKILICTHSNKAADHIGSLVYQLQNSGGSSVRVSRHYPANADVRGIIRCGQFAPETLARYPSSRDTPETVQLRQEVEQTVQELEQITVSPDRKVSEFDDMRALAKKIKELRQNLVTMFELLLDPNVVVTTGNLAAAELIRDQSQQFDTIIFDEVGQVIQPLLLVASQYLKDSDDAQLVLVGDRYQLPPPINANDGQMGRRLSRSIMEKLEDQGTLPLVRFTESYRMHPAIIAFPAQKVYQGRLTTPLEPCDRNLLAGRFPFPQQDQPIVFAAHSMGESCAAGRSVHNFFETNLVNDLVEYLLKVSRLDIAQLTVLCFYDAQRIAVFKKLKSSGIPISSSQVASVDSYQGQENDVVILVCSRSNDRGIIGFLNDYRRVNVALTRCRHGQIIVGDPWTLSTDEFWSALSNFYDAKGWMVPDFREILSSCPTVEQIQYTHGGQLTVLANRIVNE